MFDFFIQPFAEYDFMQKALWAAVMISLSGAPVGVFMNFRRLSLLGDALGHAILPGVAIAYLLAGFSSLALFVGGVTAGLIVAALSALVSQLSSQREENSLAVFYLLSLSLGVILISSGATTDRASVDLMHILFGSVLNLNDDTLISVSLTSLAVVAAFLICGRLLLFEAVDSEFGRVHGFPVRRVHFLFLFLLVVSLVSAFQALGTLMALGLMLIPAAAARFFVRGILAQILIAFGLATLASYSGLLLSFHWGWPSGPAIVVSAGFLYLVSFLAGARDGLLPKIFFKGHRKMHTPKITALMILGLGLCVRGPSAEAAPALKVVASFSILAEMSKSVGGNAVEVISLVPAGVEVHGFSLRPKDLVELKRADVFVGNGLGLESWASTLLKNSGFRGHAIYLGERLPKSSLLTISDSHAHGDHSHAVDQGRPTDPHAWQDPMLGLIYLENLKDLFVELRPEDRDEIEKRFTILKERILQIQKRSLEALASIPSDKKQALCTHDSFGYLKKAYGLRFYSPKGGNSESESSARRLADIEKHLKSGEIKVAFVDSETSPSEIGALVRKYALRQLVLHADSLTHSEGSASTYLSFLEFNADRLIEAFSGIK